MSEACLVKYDHPATPPPCIPSRPETCMRSMVNAADFSLQKTVLQCCSAISVSLATASHHSHDSHKPGGISWRWTLALSSPWPNIAVSCILCQYLTMSQCFSEIIREQSDNTTITKCKHAKAGEETLPEIQFQLEWKQVKRRIHHEDHPGYEELQQDAGHKVTELVRNLLWLQPRSHEHTEVHRFRTNGVWRRVFQIPPWRDSCQIVKHHERNKLAPRKPSSHAISLYLAGEWYVLCLSCLSVPCPLGSRWIW